MEQNTATSGWEPIYFKEINERARIAKLPDLRSAGLRENDLEVRVWIGFGVTPLEGIIIRRRSEKWIAIHLRPIGVGLPPSDSQRVLPRPKSGWEACWNHLTEEGLLTLPDSSQLEGEIIARDGESFVVEIKTNNTYRTYRYGNPHLQKWPEAKHMIRIVEITLEEFSIQRRLLAQG